MPRVSGNRLCAVGSHWSLRRRQLGLGHCRMESGRTLAVLSISGQWPYYKDVNMNVNSSPDWGDKTVDGVPGLTTQRRIRNSGDTDGWYFHLKGDSLKETPANGLHPSSRGPVRDTSMHGRQDCPHLSLSSQGRPIPACPPMRRWGGPVTLTAD